MKKSYLLAFLLPFGFACNSSFKNMQTPDDVYYSPAVMRVDNSHHDDNNTDQRPVNNPSTVIVNNNYDRPYYDDNYNTRRRRRYYYKQAEVAESGKVIVVPRTTNLGGYNNNKSTNPVNPKISGVPANPTSNGHQPVRTFKKTNGTAVGNVIRKLVNSDLGLYNTSNTPTYSNNNNNNNNQSSSTPAQAKQATSTSAPVRTFGKKN